MEWQKEGEREKKCTRLPAQGMHRMRYRMKNSIRKTIQRLVMSMLSVTSFVDSHHVGMMCHKNIILC